MCKEAMLNMKVLVVREVSCTFKGKNSTIILVASKTFLLLHLFNEDGNDFVKLLKDE
jgi:hypothetical protein